MDYWEEIRHLHPSVYYDRKCRRYKCVIRTGCAKLVRVHACAYHLFRIVALVVLENCVTRFQRQPQLFRTMTNPLSKAVGELVAERGLPVRPVLGYRYFRPQMLQPLQSDHPAVKSAIDAEMGDPFHLPQSLKDEINSYQHSSEVRDMGRLAPSIVCLGEKPPKPLDMDVLWDLFVTESLTLPVNTDGNVVVVKPQEFTPLEMVRQPQTNSASGLLPLYVSDGVTTGSKKKMHESAIAVNLQDKLGEHVPPFLPFKPALKGEVIRDSKKVRTILLESQANYMVLKHYFGKLASDWSDAAGGIAIGMSNKGGDFKAIPYSWWLETDLGHDAFLDWLATQNAHESDKSSWESSTNATDGLAFVLGLLMRVEVNVADEKLVARALADYACPHVQFDIGKVYSVPWRVPSGSYLTSYGNSKRHASMARWVVDWMASHGSAGSWTCDCAVCVEGREKDLPDWGKEVTDLELRLLDRFFVLGDDFICLNPAPYVFDWVLDRQFGTTTKTVVKPFFSTPGLEEPEGAEFLRRHFSLERTSPRQVRTFRAPGRLLGKLFRGGHRHTRERFLAAVDSAMNDCGANEQLFRVLYNLHYIIAGDGGLDRNRYGDALMKYVRKNPYIDFMALGYVPTYADMVNMDAAMLEPLLAVKRSRAAARLGMTPAQYEALGSWAV